MKKKDDESRLPREKTPSHPSSYCRADVDEHRMYERTRVVSRVSHVVIRPRVLCRVDNISISSSVHVHVCCLRVSSIRTRRRCTCAGGWTCTAGDGLLARSLARAGTLTRPRVVIVYMTHHLHSSSLLQKGASDLISNVCIVLCRSRVPVPCGSLVYVPQFSVKGAAPSRAPAFVEA